MSIIPERKEYIRSELNEISVAGDPLRQFGLWYEEAIAAGLDEPNAMILATATPEGRPSARVVLLKQYDERGFGFFTNYQSRKGQDLEANPFAALLFFWQSLERQVRIEGRVERLSSGESDEYFLGRPPQTRIGAWVSEQSQVIPNREVMETRFEELRQQFADGSIPRPPHWGGFRVVPESFEFWQGRANRLHDRLRFLRDKSGAWIIDRLAP